jgi:hypothetical protein
VVPNPIVINIQQEHEMVRPDRLAETGMVEQQPHLDRTYQHRTRLDRVTQHRDRFLVVLGALATAGPAEQVDRGVQALIGVPAVRIEQRKVTGEHLEAEWRTGEHLDH